MALTLDCQDQPLVKIVVSYAGELPPNYAGPRSIFVTALMDSGADVTVISDHEWPSDWPLIPSRAVSGVGGSLPAKRAKDEVEIMSINRDGTIERPVLITPFVAQSTNTLPGTLLKRDFLRGLRARITNL